MGKDGGKINKKGWINDKWEKMNKEWMGKNGWKINERMDER